VAFPTIPTTGASRVLTAVQANTTAARTFPSLTSLTKNAGDLLIALVAAYDTTAAINAAFGTWGASFTEFFDVGQSGTVRLAGAYKFSTGSETGTFTVTQAATITGHAVMILMSIPGAHASAPPEVGGSQGGTALNPDTGSWGPSWGSDDNLFIQFAGYGETGTAGSYDTITAAPANYTNLAVTAISGDVVGGMVAGVGFRQLAAATDDAGAWTGDASNTRALAIPIHVRPVPAPPRNPNHLGNVIQPFAAIQRALR